jgi:hypothetical protein
MTRGTLIIGGVFVLGLGFGSVLAASHLHDRAAIGVARGLHQAAADAPLAHTRAEFSFTVNAPMPVAAPLFGPEAERGWGGADWDPHFIFPLPANDIEGAVFQVNHGGHLSTWVATSLDFAAGHIQYVNIIDGAMATRIDIHLTPQDAKQTAVRIVYERTALNPAANPHVTALGEGDKGSGPHWESVINDYLKSRTLK